MEYRVWPHSRGKPSATLPPQPMALICMSHLRPGSLPKDRLPFDRPDQTHSDTVICLMCAASHKWIHLLSTQNSGACCLSAELGHNRVWPLATAADRSNCLLVAITHLLSLSALTDAFSAPGWQLALFGSQGNWASFSDLLIANC